MAFAKLGNDYLAWFATTLAGTYYMPAGQQSGTISFSRATFDTSTKDSGGWATKGAGLSDSSFSLAIEPLLPDANGYTLVESAFFASPPVPIYIKIRKNGVAATDADTIYAAPYYVTSLDGNFQLNGAVLTPFKFDLAGAPSVPFVLR